MLSESTIRAIETANKTLELDTGTTIAVCTVDTTGESDIAEYARGVFKEWKLGEGVLLLIAKDDKNYYFVQSVGVESVLTNDVLKSIRDEYLEEDFEAGDINRGVNKCVTKLKNVLTAGIPAAKTSDNTTDTSSVQDTANEKGTVAAVAKATMPSVVAITSVSIQEITSFFGYGMEYPSTGSGSGIIVGENDDELLIATNNHVIEGATTLSVCFIGDDVVNAEKETRNVASGDGDINIDDAVSAKIKGTDETNDLAVIAVEKKDIPEDTMSEIKIAQLGSSDDLVVGEQVVAIGNALGYGQTVTSGWVSALNRTITLEGGSTASNLIQTDAAINPGNSGGALLNMKGELIGINCAKYASSDVEGTGYAIPISEAQPILEDLMNRKTRDKVSGSSKAGYLDVEVTDLTAGAIQMYNMPSGAFVMRVTPGGAAEQAGIQKNDIIVKFDGQTVSGRSDLVEKLSYYTAGETIDVVVARPDDGEYKEQTISVTLASRDNQGHNNA